MSRRWFNRGRRRGTALLEAALCAAVLAPLAVAGVQYAYAFYRLEEVQFAVEEAARWSSTAPISTTEAEFVERIRNVAAYRETENKTPRVRGADPSHFRVELRKAGGRVTGVRVSAQGVRIEWPGGGKVLNGSPAAEMPRTR